MIRTFSLLALLLPALAVASDPSIRLGYQGRLTDATGVPLKGQVQVTFTIYDDHAQVLWNENQQLALTNGFFATFLGVTTAIPVSILDGRDLFIGVSAGGGELAPRQRIGLTAYAVRSIEAGHAREADHASNASEAGHASSATRADLASTVDTTWLGQAHAGSAGVATSLAGGTVQATTVSATSIAATGPMSTGSLNVAGRLEVGSMRGRVAGFAAAKQYCVYPRHDQYGDHCDGYAYHCEIYGIGTCDEVTGAVGCGGNAEFHAGICIEN